MLRTYAEVKPNQSSSHYTNPIVTTVQEDSSHANAKGPINKKEEAPNPYSKPEPIRCYHCNQLGHRSNQCPQRAMVHDVEPEEEDTVDRNDNEAAFNEDDVAYEDDGVALIVQ